jgi:hypothetical protein
MRYARIYPWRRTRRSRAPSNRPEAFFVAQFSAGYTTNNSDLICDRDNTEFLADGVNDPRRQFAETLIDALACSDDPIIVYSAYEQTRLKELAANFPDLSTALNALIARLADLLPIVRSAVYFPEFRFSNSIKSVAPALCPGFSYDDLDGVADGGAASAAFLQLASGRITDPGEVGQLRAALLAYCKRDTLAMVEVHRALVRLAAP